MQRYLYKKLKEWKDSESRKPLVLEGARQVGKTWLLKEFGKNEYSKFVYVNCDNNPVLDSVFMDYDTTRILRNLSAISKINITEDDTLIVFDEIQECPKALTSLKYFCENEPNVHIACAGSLLGLMEHHGSGFPVGRVDSLRLYPLSFMEFLLATGNDILSSEVRKGNWQELNALNPVLIELLRQYYYVGGMPQVVSSYVKNHDLRKVRMMQKQIISDYLNDISKHAPKNDIPKTSLVWNSIPSQLAKENRKFIFSVIKKGGRAKEFENAIQWLIDAGMVFKVKCVKKMIQPLKFYEDTSAFKLFLLDLGLFGAMAGANAEDVLVGDNAFSSYKGSFTEQYVAQQYVCSVPDCELYYHSNENSTLEIDFVCQRSGVYPIEVKAEENLKSKSLSSVLSRDSSLSGIRFSMKPYCEQERMVNVPLPLVCEYLKSMK